jgi:Lipocalin-like domain
MKKIVLVFISMISIGLTTVSCDKDDDKETSIEGKWIVSQEGEKVNGQEALLPHTHATGCEKDYTLFNADGTAKDYDFTKVGTNCESKLTSYTYSRNGDQLKVNFGSGEQTGTIVNLTDSELKVSVTDDDGTSIVVFTKG